MPCLWQTLQISALGVQSAVALDLGASPTETGGESEREGDALQGLVRQSLAALRGVETSVQWRCAGFFNSGTFPWRVCRV